MKLVNNPCVRNDKTQMVARACLKAIPNLKRLDGKDMKELQKPAPKPEAAAPPKDKKKVLENNVIKIIKKEWGKEMERIAAR